MLFKTRFLYLEKVVSSTIEYAKNYIKDNSNLESNVVIIAEAQSSGVGKLNRNWSSPKGNLYLTAIFKSFDNYSWNKFKDINILNLLITVSVIELVGTFVSNKETCFCKWPNDIIVRDNKISGILLERISPKYGDLLLASIGFNIKVAPEVNNIYKTISLNQITEVNIEPKEFGNKLILKIYNNIKNLTKEEVIDKWMSYAYKLDKIITIRTSNIETTGIFRGISEEGLLLLELDNKEIKKISVGEVY